MTILDGGSCRTVRSLFAGSAAGPRVDATVMPVKMTTHRLHTGMVTVSGARLFSLSETVHASTDVYISQSDGSCKNMYERSFGELCHAPFSKIQLENFLVTLAALHSFWAICLTRARFA